MSGHAHDEAAIREVHQALSDLADVATEHLCGRYPGGWSTPPEFVEGSAKINAAVRSGRDALARLTVDTPGQPSEQATAGSGGHGSAVPVTEEGRDV